ncbi:C40 family peptidase [Treponema sp. HNW]|uniref:C40 family peptidase n=1 Tax=Treponema sp. HNW TaxID=3116654 RepID=UPI003D0DB816
MRFFRQIENKGAAHVCAHRIYFIFVSLYALLCAALLSAQSAPPAPGFASESDAASARALREKVIRSAKQYVGVPYRYGGLSVTGMDCSGFIYTVAREAAQVQLPRTAAAMYSFCRIVNDAKKEAGDILFFRDGGKITHAGLYIGNNQFIHAVSDGPNTGVIVSSLNQTTWKQKYAACGQFLPSAQSGEKAAADAPSAERKNGSEHKTALSDEKVPSDNTEFILNTAFDFSGRLAWNFYTADGFRFNIRGVYFQAHMLYTRWMLQPGVGIDIRIMPPMKIAHLPLRFTLSVPYGFRIYAGPVFTIGKPQLSEKGIELKAPVFPGLFGINWQSPPIAAGEASLSFVQDLSWTIFKNPDNSRLSAQNAIASGMTFSSGIRVTVPTKKMFK